MKAFHDSSYCDGDSFDATIGLDKCSPISASSSWQFECSGFCSLPEKFGMLIVSSLVVLLMMISSL